MAEGKKMKRRWPGDKLMDYVLVVVFIGIIFITVYPFLNVLAISLNDPMDTMRNVNFIIPRKWTLANYIYVFTENDLIVPFIMSVARTLLGTGIGVICTAMIAYVLSRKDFYFNLGNNFMVYILPGLIWVYNVILMRSFIEGLPMALQEAAKIDGANDFIIWARIILPLCKPAIATVALFIAVGQWNSFMDTYLYARDYPTLQYVLYEIMQQATIRVDPHAADSARNTVSPLSVRMAITIIATVPILVVYPFLQKYFVGGMTLGAVKD